MHLIPRHLPALAPHGLWVAGEFADYVFYDANASKVRQSLIIGHEYGHMMFDDVSTPTSLERLAAILMPSSDPSVPQIALARSTYDEPIERRAEVFGTIAVQRAESWSELPTGTRLTPRCPRGWWRRWKDGSPDGEPRSRRDDRGDAWSAGA